MSETALYLPVAIAFVSAIFATWATRRLTQIIGVLDVPNERSSHAEPTPTLGGIGLIVGAVLGVLVADRAGVTFVALPENAFIGTAALILLFGRDEIRPMGRLMKLLLQCAAALLLVGHGVRLGGVTAPGFDSVALGLGGAAVTFLWLVASQNIYNFMDGIDGLVALCGALAAGFLALMFFDLATDAALMCTLVAAASAGFLLWNLPPARIFLGDVGSHFLGLILAVMAVIGQRYGVPFWLSVSVMGALLFDAAYTVGRRLARGENVTVAHRYHLYQRAVRLGASHGLVTMVYAGLTVLLGVFSLGVMASRWWAVWLGVAILLMVGGGTLVLEREWGRRGEDL